MICPACGDQNAYVGFSDVDCPNTGCKHFQGGSVVVSAPPQPNSTPTPPPTASPFNFSFFPNPTPRPNIKLTVKIIATAPKISTVHISFMADGDPGRPDKEVEFYWWTNKDTTRRIATLTSAQRYRVIGVNADGRTIYKTNWMAKLDGHDPNNTNDQFILEPKIY